MPRKKVPRQAAPPWNPTYEKGFEDAKDKAKMLYNKFGVRAVVVRAITDAHHKIAGYAGLESSEEMIALCTGDYRKNGPLSRMNDHWKASFGYATAGGRDSEVQWEAKEILEFLYKWKEPHAVVTQEARTAEILNNTLPLDKEKWPLKMRARGLLGLVISLKAIADEYSRDVKLFAGTANYDEPTQIVAGLHAEDWYRTFQLFRYFRYRFMQFITEKDKADADGSDKKSRPRASVVAGLMYYLSDADLTGEVDNTAQQLASAVGLAEAWGELAATEDAADTEVDLSAEQILKRAEEMEINFTNREKNPEQIARGNRLAQASAKYSPAPSSEMTERFLNACEGRNGNLITRDTDLVNSLTPAVLEQYQAAVSSLQDMSGNLSSDQHAQEQVAGESAVQEQWFKLNRMTNEAAARTPPLAEAMEMLGISGANMAYGSRVSGVPDIPMRPHQITGAAASLEMLASPLHMSVVADSVGLGKTRQALAVIDEYATAMEHCPGFSTGGGFVWPLKPQGNLRRADIAQNMRGPAKPSLVIMPANASSTWKGDVATWERAGRLKGYYWLSDQKQSGGRGDSDSRYLPASVTELKKFLDSFDENDPQTIRTVVVCSINCFARRTTSYKEGYVKPKYSRHEDDDDSPSESISDELAAHSFSELKGYAGLVVIDEVHKFKNIATLCHNSIVKLEPRFLLCLTATPVWNTAVDLSGLLSFVAITREKTLGIGGGVPEEAKEVTEDLLLSLSRTYETAVVRARNDPEFAEARRPHAVDYSKVEALLDVRSFRAYANANAENFELAGSALRLVTRLVCVRRVRGELHDNPDGSRSPICGEVPAPLIHTIMLQFAPYQKKEYDFHAKKLYQMLYPAGGGDDEGVGGRRSQQVHRVLSHMTHSLVGLYMSGVRAGGKLTTSTDPVTAARTINTTIHKALAGPRGAMLAVPRDRITSAETMVNLSPKHAVLAVLVNNIVVQQGLKMIVFESWPVSQWLTEQLLGLLGVKYKSMRADHSSSTREAMVDEFNRADDPDRVFVISLRVGSSSLNLQSQCSHVVFMQPPENQHEQEQGQGRVIRIGQAKTPVIITLALGASYDEQLMSRAERKMLPMIAANQDSGTMTDDEAKSLLQDHASCVLAAAPPMAQAQQLRNEKIYQLLTGSTCTFAPRRRIDDCNLLQFETCGHVSKATAVAPSDGKRVSRMPKKTPRKATLTLAEYTQQARDKKAKKSLKESKAAEKKAAKAAKKQLKELKAQEKAARKAAAKKGKKKASDSEEELSDSESALSETEEELSDSELALSDSELALSEPELALSEPELALSEPELALSEPEEELSDVNDAVSKNNQGKTEPATPSSSRVGMDARKRKRAEQAQDDDVASTSAGPMPKMAKQAPRGRASRGLVPPSRLLPRRAAARR